MAYIFSSVLLLSSCEHDSNSTTTTDIRERQETVNQRSSVVPGGRDGDIYFFGTTGWDVIVTSKTKVYRERPSCSGLEGVSPSEIKNGDVIFFKYKTENVDYGLSPNTVRPKIIEAYPPDCITEPIIPEPEEEDCECNVCNNTCNNGCLNSCVNYSCNVCWGN